MNTLKYSILYGVYKANICIYGYRLNWERECPTLVVTIPTGTAGARSSVAHTVYYVLRMYYVHSSTNYRTHSYPPPFKLSSSEPRSMIRHLTILATNLAAKPMLVCQHILVT